MPNDTITEIGLAEARTEFDTMIRLAALRPLTKWEAKRAQSLERRIGRLVIKLNRAKPVPAIREKLMTQSPSSAAQYRRIRAERRRLELVTRATVAKLSEAATILHG